MRREKTEPWCYRTITMEKQRQAVIFLYNNFVVWNLKCLWLVFFSAKHCFFLFLLYVFWMKILPLLKVETVLYVYFILLLILYSKIVIDRGKIFQSLPINLFLVQLNVFVILVFQIVAQCCHTLFFLNFIKFFQFCETVQSKVILIYLSLLLIAAKDLINRLLVVDPKRRYTAQQVLQHLWIHTAGKNNNRNLQREVTINLEQHFRSQRKSEVTKEDS